jgi:hypothetical protein
MDRKSPVFGQQNVRVSAGTSETPEETFSRSKKPTRDNVLDLVLLDGRDIVTPAL